MKRSGKRVALAVCLAVLVLIAAGCLAVYVISADHIVTEITVALDGGFAPADFVQNDIGWPVSLESDQAAVDLGTQGDYPVTVRYAIREFECVVHVRDLEAPSGSAQDLTRYSVYKPEASDFVTEVRDQTSVTVTYQTEPDMQTEGAQTVRLLLTDEGGNVTELTATLTVIVDTQGPEILGVGPFYVRPGQEPDYFAGVTVTDDYDAAPTMSVENSEVDLEQLGTYEITYRALDEAGNETVLTSTVMVTDDETPPTILGVHEIAVYTGSTVSYRSGIKVTDDKDPAPKLTVDSSKVDLSTPGSYTVYYQAQDNSGNVAEQSASVTVKEKPATYVEESVIYAMADEVIAQIITEDMTAEQQCRAIYDWVRGNFTYSGHSEKTDWLQGAYIIMTERKGDCFNFFGVSKLLLERLGIPTIDVRKVPNYTGDTNHYWSMVSVDGGETYYHFDTTPYPGSSAEFCLATDADLAAFSASHRGYFNRDESLYPATPTE